jgi:Acyl-protein synthetase, LuxE
VISYPDESRRLDEAVLGHIERWRTTGQSMTDDEFNELALRIFDYQLHYNTPYADYCAKLGVTRERLPSSWEEIPPVPSAAFKEATLAPFNPHNAALVFETSGTTRGEGGRHYMETATLYDASLLASFQAFVIPDHVRLRYLNLVPDPSENPHSSLGYMMKHVSDQFGDGATGWFVHNGELDVDALVGELESAIAHDRPVCIATTAFALVHLLDGLAERSRYFALPSGSRIMETGGFKGRSRYVDRYQLYKTTAERFGSTLGTIISEYGMTELTSQYYDDVIVRQALEEATEPRYKSGPPWLRARVVGADNKTLPHGTVGALVHVDLANRSSCLAIQTEDLGVEFAPSEYGQRIVLMGRDADASLRGCSLSAEDLVLK